MRARRSGCSAADATAPPPTRSVARVAAVARWRWPARQRQRRSGRTAPFLCFASQRPVVERAQRLGDRRLRPAAPADLVRRSVRRQRSEGTEAFLRMSQLAWSQARPALCARVSPHRRGGAARSARVPVRRRHCTNAAASALRSRFSKALPRLLRHFGRYCTVNSPSFCGARRWSTCGAAVARERCWQRHRRHVQSVRYPVRLGQQPLLGVPCHSRIGAHFHHACPVAPAVPVPRPPLRVPCVP